MKDTYLIKSHADESMVAYRILDLLLIFLGYLAIVTSYVGSIDLYHLLIVTVGVTGYSFMSEIVGVYSSRNKSTKQRFVPIIFAWIFSVAALVSVALVFKQSSKLLETPVAIWFVYVPVALTLYRFLYATLSSNLGEKSYKQKSIIIGSTPAGLSLAEEIQSNRELGLKLVGIFDDRSADRISTGTDKFPLLGSINDALKMAKERDFRHVYVALPMHASERIKQIIQHFSDSTARVYIVPDFFTYDLIQSRWRNVGNIPTLSIHDTPFYGLSTVFKRIEDIVLSSIILLLISPILLAVAIGVKLSSKGPVIFKQDRYGVDGKKIKVWKFRSMSTQDNGSDVKQATKNDPRVTKFGAFIRRTSLDELPQFYNVLQGKMSIVGPRPHAVAHNEQYRTIVERYMLRHKVKPGITGWAQINGYRGETDTLDKMEKRVEYDLWYIRNWSLFLDIKIVFLTLFKGFVSKTAY